MLVGTATTGASTSPTSPSPRTSDGARRCGLLTDTGHVTSHIVAMLQACDALLQPERFKDYGPNGLQVEGRAVEVVRGAAVGGGKGDGEGHAVR